MAVSLFSKPLTLLIGLLIVGVQVCFLFLLYLAKLFSILPSISTSFPPYITLNLSIPLFLFTSLPVIYY
jgi:hypothetical protein